MRTQRRPASRSAALGVAKLALALAAAVALLLASMTLLTSRGLSVAPAATLAWWAAAVVAALHRPLGGATLGLGALALAPVIDLHGAGPAAWLASLAFMTAALIRQLAGPGAVSPRALEGRRDWRSFLARTAAIALAALAAGAVRQLAPSSDGWLGWRELLALIAYAGLLGVMTFVFWPPIDRRPARILARLSPIALDAAGWLIGTLLAALVPTAGMAQTLLIAWVVALLAGEAARNAILRGVSDHRIGDLQDLQRAHERILTEAADMAGIAQQVYIECRNVLPVDYFQFELFQPEGERSWTAGPGGLLGEGRPQPTPQPRPLPGIHRRAVWRLIEQPLTAEGRTMATLRLWCDPRRIEPGSEELLANLVPQMASSVHRAILDREAKTDPLTGVPVRRLLESRMQTVYRSCLEEGRSMAIIMTDIDHFKRVNDTWGHSAGDQALVLVARTLDSERREKDLCCRYGGEEFVLLLEETRGAEALRLAERLRQAVEALDFAFEGQHIPLTLSCGVAAFPELHIKTPAELRLLADEALYAAKEQGRNRCLLNLGREAFRAPDDEPVETPPTLHHPPPRIFG